jgi:hypothetical protein
MDIPTLPQSSEFLSVVPVPDTDVCKATNRLKPSNSAGLDDNHGFVIKGCSIIFIHIEPDSAEFPYSMEGSGYCNRI